MKVKKEIKVNEDETLSKEKVDDLFLKLVRGNDVTEQIETSRGSFEVKYPKQKDFIRIGRIIAYKHNGLNANCFDVETEATIKATAYLDVCVVDGPAWYKNAKKEKESWNWEDVPDVQFLTELYIKAQTFRKKVEESFRKDKDGKANELSITNGNDSDVHRGIFDGLSSSESE